MNCEIKIVGNTFLNQPNIYRFSSSKGNKASTMASNV